jgi:UDP-glucose:glycoprotein glucosyltransferase
LDRARRQVPEWTIYDQEIAALDLKRKKNSQSQRGETETERTSSENRQAKDPYAKDEL